LERDPDRCFGNATIPGTRIQVWRLVDLHDSGFGYREIARSYGDRITAQQVEDAIRAYALDGAA
jgi:uncharacterized protein (DUF433 family)